MKKVAVLNFPSESPIRVVLHAEWQRQRGRQPSMPYRGILNPREAHLVAMIDAAALLAEALEDLLAKSLQKEEAQTASVPA
ncbi:MAG: hypothetical protein WC027_01965 [Candidatus Paceibacterota bacterium]